MSAALAHHEVTPLDPLNEYVALRAFLDSLLPCQSVVEALLQSGVQIKVPLLAGNAFMCFLIAHWAYSRKTGRAFQQGLVRTAAVDLLAIRCRAVLQLLRMLFKVCHERGFDEVLE
jgi:hypothetical protein